MFPASVASYLFFLTKVKNIIFLISLCWILICIFVPYFPSHYIESIPSCILNYLCLCHLCAVSGLCCVLCSGRKRRQPLLNIKFTINLLLAWSSLTMQYFFGVSGWYMAQILYDMFSAVSRVLKNNLVLFKII